MLSSLPVERTLFTSAHYEPVNRPLEKLLDQLYNDLLPDETNPLRNETSRCLDKIALEE